MAVVILVLPSPTGLSVAAWQLFAIYLAAIFGLVLRPSDEAVILLGGIAAAGLAFGNMGALLSGYASSSAWLVFSAFLIGAATMIPVLFTIALVAKVSLLPLLFLIAFAAG